MTTVTATAERHAVGEAYGSRAAEAIGKRAAVTAATVARAEDRLRHAMRANVAATRRREQRREAEEEIRGGYGFETYSEMGA